MPAFDNEKTPEYTLGEAIKSGKLQVNQNTILYNKLNVRFKRVWNIDFAPTKNCICSTEYLTLKPDGIDRDYLYYVLISEHLTQTMEGHRTGTSSSHQRIKPESLLNYEIDLPDLETQHAIADRSQRP
ncbi:MAG: restriction endonuclease subunit S [Oscillospiraceae bacterium]|nr:restriction endonuclease subunit S [Oscillospiraceae bacterium]